jgi:cell surface protein SprA
LRLRGQILSFTLVAVFVANLVQPKESKASWWMDPVNAFLMPADTPELKYPIKDNQSVLDDNDDPFYLDNPPNVKREVDYDPETGLYVIRETVGGRDIKPPMYMTYDEYVEYTLKQDISDYWKNREATAKGIKNYSSSSSLFDKLTIPGGDPNAAPIVEIRPQGTVELTLGVNFQKIDNPTLPLRQRKQGGFDFDMNINLNVIGKIADYVQLGIKYNTQANFDFQNEIKTQYEGKEDDIIKKIEAGNVNFSLPTQLISGSQQLFGVRAELQFGKLRINSVISSQRSQKQSITIEGGAQIQNFEVNADNYDNNRHFFLGQVFRDFYEPALADFPLITSNFQIQEIEVWVTNRSGATQNVREVVAFADLGEPDPYSPQINLIAGQQYMDNDANDLYRRLNNNSLTTRDVNQVVSTLTGPNFNLKPIDDFEKTYAQKLQPNQYTFDPQLGYISLNQQLQPNQVLGVAYVYTVNGETFKVGDLSRELGAGDTTAQANKVLFLKMLKSTSIRTKLPYWDLLMKNIYSLGAFNVQQEDFQLNVLYRDPGGGLKRYIPEGNLSGVPLLEVMGLDKVNNQGDPQQDGIFDFIPNVTIIPQNGRIIFPVLEPFGDHLRSQITNPSLQQKYVYDQLYDSTQFIAQQYPEYNRFVIEGRYKGGSSNEISLGAFNIPEGSVVVTLGGQRLQEGVHYTVDYNLGRVKIIDEGILASGNQIKVDFENNALFGFQTRALYGVRLDYRLNEKLSLGGTAMRMGERPFTQKVNIGDDPIQNSIYGLDLNYNTEVPFLTKVLDKLPFYSTKEISTFTLNGEVAHLNPGHAGAIGDQGQVYIDDFEGTSSGFDLKFPAAAWRLASTPRGAPDENGNVLFPEGDLINSPEYGYNRAKLAWYNIDPLFSRNNLSTPDYIKNDPETYVNHYVREIPQNEVYPNKDIDNPLQATLLTFDMAYYPYERGPYNYDTTAGAFSAGTDPNSGNLIDPESRWGGIMRSLDNTDFQSANIEYIQFWVLDPYIGRPVGDDGYLYINLGNISEDVLRDSRMLYENGLRIDSTELTRSRWGYAPTIPPINNAFDNNVDQRTRQDVGFDGATDEQEQRFFNSFASWVQNNVADQDVVNDILADPSQDNYQWYRDQSFDQAETDVLIRYKDFNGPHGNSPVSSGQANSSAATNIPDSEDMNRDFTLNENEEYFQYRVPIFKGMSAENHPYIVSQEGPKNYNDQVNNILFEDITWYQFRVPVRDYDDRVGGIQDFNSIQFMRMFMTGFQDSVILRFAELELVRNQWRTYLEPLGDPGDGSPNDNSGQTTFNVTAVNIIENSRREPVSYVLPPDIQREVTLGQSQTVNVRQNEQSLATTVCNLKDGDARAVFKNLGLDLRVYEELKMWVHAEDLVGQVPMDTGEVTAFIRIGADFVDNYYEYEIPLTITPPNPAGGFYDNENLNDRQIVWPEQNEMVIQLADLVRLKLQRDSAGLSINLPFSVLDQKGGRYTVKGNPDLGYASTIMLGVRNPKQDSPYNPRNDDNGLAKCVEVWWNELRVNGLLEESSSAAVASMNIKLADLGNINLSTEISSIGFGQIEQRVDDRQKEKRISYDFSTNLNIGKLFGEKAGIQIPFYGGISQTFITPQFDPYKLDLPTDLALNYLSGTFGGDSAKAYKRQIQSVTTRSGYNFTGVRFMPPGTRKKRTWFFDPGNFTFNYAYTKLELSDAFVESDLRENYTASINYAHSPQAKYLYPFKKLIKGKSKYLDIFKEINFNFVPNSITFNTGINRQFGELRLRDVYNDGLVIKPTYNKFFTWDRSWGLRYNPFKSVSLDFNASMNTRIDEPEGRIDTKQKRQQMWSNFGDGGRPTNYQHSFNASYNLPINKIPILSFVNARASYASTYNWIAGPRQLDPVTNEFTVNRFGNSFNNSQNVQLNGDFNMNQLYNQSPFLKPYNGNKSTLGDKEKTRQQVENVKKAREKIEIKIDELKEQKKEKKEEIVEVKQDTSLSKEEAKPEIKKLKKEKKDLKKQIKKQKKAKRKKALPAQPGKAIAVQPLIMVKKVTVNYQETKSTTVNGYMHDPGIMGHTRSPSSPGWDFLFGAQPGHKLLGSPDEAARNGWLQNGASNGWFTGDTLFNQNFIQNSTKTLDVRATVEPWRDLRVDLSLNRSFTLNNQQLFKQETTTSPYEHFNPIEFGSYTISTVTWKTMFDKIDAQGLSNTYETFLDNRSIISQRLGDLNPNSNGFFNNPNDTLGPIPTYSEGYGPTSQDVLIPAFLSAYQSKNPNTAKLRPNNYVPLPNWRITYNGLSKFAWAKKVFNNIQISHGYSSTMTINSFSTNLLYDGQGGVFEAAEIDSLSGNFHPLYRTPNIIINEQLSPLIGIDMTFKNNVTAKFDYKKSRTLTMSFVDNQLIENKSTSVTLGIGWKVKGLVLPIKRKDGTRIKLDNDLTMRFDMTIRDNVVVNHRLQQGISEPTSGQKAIAFNPFIEYTVSKALNVRFFVNRTRTIPKTSAQFPITTTQAGFTVRFSLVP